MPLDHDAEILIKMIQEANRPTFESVGAVAARDLYMAGRKALSPDPMPIAETRDVAIPGSGGPIPARLYRSAKNGTLPVLVFFHGGGWVVGNIDSHDAMCRHIANRAVAFGVNSSRIQKDFTALNSQEARTLLVNFGRKFRNLD